MRLWRTLQHTPDLRAMAAAQFLAGVPLGTFGLLFGLYVVALGHHADVIGAATAATTLTLSAAALGAAWCAHHVGIARTMLAGVLLLAGGYAVQALSGVVPLLLAGAALAGAGTAALVALQMPLVAERIAEEERQDAGALLAAAQALATTAGALLAGAGPAVLARSAWAPVAAERATLLAATALGLGALLPLVRLARDAPPAAARAHRRPRLVGHHPHPHSATRQLTRRYAAATALIAAGAGAFLPFAPLYLTRFGASTGGVGVVLAATGLAGAVLGLVGPAVAHRWGAERIAVGLRLLPVFPACALLAVPGVGTLVAAYVARQLGAGLTWPIEAALLSARLPAAARVDAFSLRTAAWNAAWAASGAATGVALTHGWERAPFVVLIASTAAGSLVLARVFGGTAAAVPSATRPAAVPSATQPAAVPSATQPAAVPSATRPAAVPSATQPAAVPSATQPAAVPSATQPAAVPSATQPAAAAAPHDG